MLKNYDIQKVGWGKCFCEDGQQVSILLPPPTLLLGLRSSRLFFHVRLLRHGLRSLTDVSATKGPRPTSTGRSLDLALIGRHLGHVALGSTAAWVHSANIAVIL